MAEKLDPQVQVRIVDIAWQYATTASKQTGPLSGKTNLEIFEIAYKALLKTLTE